MKTLFVGVCVAVTCLLFGSFFAGCATSRRELSNKEIADRVEATLRSAVYIEDKTVVTQKLVREDGVLPGGVGPFNIDYKAARGLLNAQLSTEKGLKNAFTLFGGTYQEIRPFAKMSFIEYPTPLPHGTDNLVGSGPQDCLMGSHIYSWLGADNAPPNLWPDRAASMRQKIEQGKRLPDAMDRGHNCYVFCQTLEKDVPEPANRFIYETVYVDRESFLVVRWDTETWVNGYFRSRLMDTKVFNKIPEGVEWRMTLK